MALSAGEVYLDVVPNLSGFTATFQKALGSIQKQLGSGLTSAATAGFAVLGAVAIKAISAGVEATTEWASGTRELQRVTGQTAESASALLAVGERLGLSSTQLATGFGLLSKNIENAAPNLAKYGIEVKDASGATLPFDTILANAADKFETLAPGAEQAAFAMNVFGRSGKQLIPLLSQGADGIEALKARAEELGLVMSQDDVDAAKALTISQRELGSAVKGLEISIGTDFLPLVTDVIETFTGWLEVLTRIPAPIKDVVLAVAALTGAIAAFKLLAGFFVGVWGPLISGLTGATVATEGQTAAAVQLTLAFEAEAEAATAAGAATTGAAAAATGGLTSWIAKLALFGTTLKRVGGTALAAYTFLGASTVPAKDTLDQIESQLRIIETARRGLDSGVRGAGLKPLIHDTFELADSLGADMDAFRTAAREGVTYEEVIGRIADAQETATQAITDNATAILTSTDQLARVSGQDLSQVQSDIASLLDPKTQGDPAKFFATLQDALVNTRHAFRAWHDDIVSNFGGASAALSDFYGRTGLSFDKINETLQHTRDRLKTWQADFDKILAQGGQASKTFLQDMSDQGLNSIGVLQAVAAQPRKVRDQFLENYNKVNDTTSTLADDIQSAFSTAFDKIVFQLRNIVRVFQGLPPLKFNVTADTTAAKRQFQDFVSLVEGSHVRVDVLLNTPSVPRTALGGIVTSPEVRVVGEKGPEAIVPLREWDKHRVAAPGVTRSTGNTQRIYGDLRMRDWRQGIATLDGEVAWEDLARSS